MDPITIGIAVGIGLLERSASKLLAKATDPEVVAKSINWVFSAVDNFLKIRKKEKPQSTPIPAPPPASVPPSQQQVSVSEVGEKTRAAMGIIKSADQAPEALDDKGIKLELLDEFAIQQLGNEVESLLKQLETYLGNLRFEEEKASLFGGVQFTPPIVMNTIRIQQEEIAERLLRLNNCMRRAYNVSAPNLDTLVEVTKTR